MRPILAGDDTVGRKIFALMPSARAAKATATPWLPPEAAVTPAGGIRRNSRLAKAPRALNEPECCSCSSLSTSRIGANPKSAPSTATIGVSRTWPRMRSNVSVIAAGLTDAFMVRSSLPGLARPLTLIRELANCKYAYSRCRQGGRQRPQAPDPPLAEEAARAFSPSGRRRPRPRRRLRPSHCAKARREPADGERASEDPHAGRPAAHEARQAVDLLSPRRAADRGDQDSAAGGAVRSRPTPGTRRSDCGRRPCCRSAHRGTCT